MTTKEYISVTETAKLVRAALKKQFPTIKFSVRSDRYAGGASIDVRWTDGPTTAQVDPIIKAYEGGDFDGSIDMATSQSHYLFEDGSTVLAHARGTEGSMGRIPEVDNRLAGMQEVRFMADFVFSRRDVTNFVPKCTMAEAMIRRRCICDGEAPTDRFGGHWVQNLATALVYGHAEDETWDTAFNRIVLRNPTEEE